MSTILGLYKVKFSSSTQFATLNRIVSSNSLMSQFIGTHYRIMEVDQLLDGLNDVLNNQLPVFWTYTQSMQFMIADSTSAGIYEDMDTYDNDSNAAPDYSIPTTDFVVIVQAWRDYLNKSPHKLGE